MRTDKRLKTKNSGAGVAENRHGKDFVFYILCLGCCILCLSSIAGCNAPEQQNPLQEQIKQVTAENTQLISQIEKLESENRQLEKQNQVLAGLPDDVKGENLYKILSVNIKSTSGLYDKDDDGKKETLTVYLQPIDEYGNIFKAAGSAEVELWNLNNTDGQALLGQWTVNSKELKKSWIALLQINYRLVFDISEKVTNFDEPLTIKTKFTDYLSGKVFQDQKVIEP